MKNSFCKFKDNYFEIWDSIRDITHFTNYCCTFANEYYTKLDNNFKNFEEKKVFKKNISYLETIKKLIEEIEDILDEIDFYIDYPDDDDIWVPIDAKLPPMIFEKPKHNIYLIYPPKNQS